MTAADADAPRASGAPTVSDRDDPAPRSLRTITLSTLRTRAATGRAETSEPTPADWRVLLDPRELEVSPTGPDAARSAVEHALRSYLPANRWYPAGQHGVARVEVIDSVWLPGAEHERGHDAPADAHAEDDPTPRDAPGDRGPTGGCLVLIDVTSPEGRIETFLLPLTTVDQDQADHLLDAHPNAGIAWLEGFGPGSPSLLLDGLVDAAFGAALLRALARGDGLTSRRGKAVTLAPTARLRAVVGSSPMLEPRVMGVEQSNTSVVFGTDVVLKVLRRPRPGQNPDLEVGRVLTDEVAFAHTAPVIGGIEYAPATEEERTLAVANAFVVNDGDAWEHALRSLSAFAHRWPRGDGAPIAPPWAATLADARPTPPARAREVIGPFFDDAGLLGRRTAQLHLALASATDPAFRPEPLGAEDERNRQQQVADDLRTTLALLRRSIDQLDPPARRDANVLLGLERAIEARARDLPVGPGELQRIRVHGDYHLGQVLHVPARDGDVPHRVGGDFVIVDFEGEPSRSLAERRRRRPALVDVAGMVRSFQYAAHAGFLATADADDADAVTSLTAAERFWYDTVVAQFLAGYRSEAAGAPFLPSDAARFEALLAVHVLDKALYEIRYELGHRPDWVAIPLRGVVELFEEDR